MERPRRALRTERRVSFSPKALLLPPEVLLPPLVVPPVDEVPVEDVPVEPVLGVLVDPPVVGVVVVEPPVVGVVLVEPPVVGDEVGPVVGGVVAAREKKECFCRAPARRGCFFFAPLKKEKLFLCAISLLSVSLW